MRLTTCRYKAEHNIWKLLTDIRLEFFACMNWIAVKIDNSNLIVIEIWISLDDLTMIWLKNMFNPLLIVIHTLINVIVITMTHLLHCLECAKMTPLFITFCKGEIESISLCFSHPLCYQ